MCYQKSELIKILVCNIYQLNLKTHFCLCQLKVLHRNKYLYRTFQIDSVIIQAVHVIYPHNVSKVYNVCYVICVCNVRDTDRLLA